MGTLDGGQVYIAMALVDGLPLDTWLKENTPNWQEIVQVFAGAARGLAAAHQAGIVHRDFKPSNVLVDSQSVAQVVDFGLARFVGLAEPASGSQTKSEEGTVHDVGSSESLTVTGAVLGTPLYMAPEQHRGEPADERSDQFSFCASLYEALYGVRAFKGDVAVAKQDGAIRPPPADARVPSRLWQLVERGLQPDPARRFPSMEALLTQLLRRRNAPVRVGVGLAATGLIALAWSAWSTEPRPCGDSDGAFASVWGDTERSGLAATFESPDTERRAAWARIEAGLDQYADSWRSSWRENCEATAVHHTQSQTLGDQRTACMARLRRRFGALLTALLSNEADAWQHAGPAIVELTPLSACTADRVEQFVDASTLALDPEALADVESDLAAGAAALVTGDHHTALARSRAAVQSADALGHLPLRAEAHFLEARALGRSNRLAQSIDGLDTAVALAMESRRELIEADARRARMYNLSRAGRTQEAVAACAQTLAAARRSGVTGAIVRAHAAVAYVLAVSGDFEGSVEMGQAAVEVARVDGDKTLPLADAQVILAAGLAPTGDLESAELELRAAVEIYEEVLGPNHPRAANAHYNLGSVLFERQEFADARAHHTIALEVRRSAMAPDHPEIADALLALAGDQMALGEGLAALASARAAHQLYRRAHGAVHHDTARAATGVGLLELEFGSVDESIALLEGATNVYETLFPATDARRGEPLLGLGQALVAGGRHLEAIPRLQTALTFSQTVLGADHPQTAEIRQALRKASEGVQDSRPN